ncbi:MAG: DNA internalization-related competence protein ComEC/Rec2 [Dehalobacterium sp.]
MPRVLVLHTLGFVFGIFIGDFFHVPITAAFALAIAALVLSLYVIIKGRDIRAIVIFTLCVGLLWGQIQINKGNHQADLLPPGDTIQGVGTVAGQPRPTASGKIFSFSLEQVKGSSISSMKIHVLCSSQEEVRYGDVLEISGKVMDGSEASNPGQFDYDQYLKRHGISASVSTLYGGEVKRTGANRGNVFMKAVIKIKERMDLVLNHLPPQQKTFIGGMLFGNKGDLTFSERNVLSQTGLMDAFAVSGVHVGYVVLFTLYFAQMLKLNKWGRLLLVSLAVVFYAALSEFTPSVLRSGSMALLGLLAYSLGEKKDFFTGLALAALPLLIWNPEMIYDAGFQLSFAAAWGVVYLLPTVSLWFPKKAPWEIFAATVAAQLAIMPLIAYYFNLVTVSGLIVGILASGLVGLVVLLGLFSVLLSVISPWLAVLPAYGAGIVVEGIWQGAKFISHLPGSYMIVKTPSLFFLFIFYGFLIGLPYLAKVKKGRIYSALAAMIMVICLVLPMPGSGLLTVTFLDVGQGDAIFVRSPSGRNCLIDGGGKPNEIGDSVGEQVVVPYLQNIGLGKLDLVILTHPHDDHMKGLVTVLAEMQADRLVFAENFLKSPALAPLLDLASNRQVPLIPVSKGQAISLDQEVKLMVLSPAKQSTPPDEEEENNNSLVIKLTYQDISFLLTGDAEMACLSSLLDCLDLDSQVLKLPHHGSKTGFLPDFYEQVSPKAVVICVGKNSFGHPAPDIIDYWEERNTPLYRTDREGAITFSTNGKELWVETFKHPEAGSIP